MNDLFKRVNRLLKAWEIITNTMLVCLSALFFCDFLKTKNTISLKPTLFFLALFLISIFFFKYQRKRAIRIQKEFDSKSESEEK